MSSAIIIYTVCASSEEAQKIARAIVGERLAACANILPEHQSFYWWDGAVQEGREHVLILKTRAKLFEQTSDLIRSLHSYECPCIVSWPIDKGHEPFMRWIQDETIPG